MKIHQALLKTLRSKTVKIGAALILTVSGLGFLPTFTENANAKPSSSRVTQTKGRWIEVDLSSQRLVAWNGKQRVKTFIVSSGKRRTPTRTGTYRIRSKVSSTRMRGRGYNVPNVPSVMYYSGGYAIHGAYWHKSFGTPVSHGCVNLPVSQARWLYNWAPMGTRVVIHQ
ncbi:MAG TPA: hypothetical protein DEG17_22015 [Cyanobacteria bacterium UBA11149]|nr:hypothetical protein [Cyanobacteria bacterium UBA11367]HBE57821.1 hypothetical protein [Cyanobacteria bacterium UBA11366]HBK66088.1 hypothetical protein [Cyanobacteria bacterium UBA11166]HBR73511.1 hypothetical protein [Cyanobacteria bacterium UBA11159]HBS68953.1 hypothetical protein [Cyanobacteria bacterium UBA11153]HBW91459.1 hypothetical protein [Cyanobacteria bacterium UBA11149]HCA96821.1 hypothetical protein [Cyanobacteria bacterium UBA9226]